MADNKPAESFRELLERLINEPGPIGEAFDWAEKRTKVSRIYIAYGERVNFRVCLH